MSVSKPCLHVTAAAARVAGECVGGSEGVTPRMFVNGIAVDRSPQDRSASGPESRDAPAEVEFDDFLVTRAR